MKKRLSTNHRNALSAQRRDLLQKKGEKGLNEAQQARLDRIEVRLGIQKEAVRQQMRSVTTRKPATPQATTPSNTETNNLSDHQRMEHAVAEAVQSGLIREEILSSNQPTSRKGYILSASHYSNYEYDPAKVDPQTRTSQIQLFQLVHLMNQEEVKGPLYCEGRNNGGSYSAFRGAKPMLEIASTSYDIHSPEAQKFLFEHPDVLGQVMDQQLPIAQQLKASTPIFYSYAHYNNTQGGHTDRVEQKMDAISSDAKWNLDFEAKFKFLTSAIGTGNVNFQIGTGWDDQGKPMLELAEQWIYTSELIPLIEYFLGYADKLADFDRMREEDMATLMLQTNPDQVPSCFCGLGHTLMLAEKMKDQMDVHVLTPAASTHLDKMRRTLPINHPKAGLMNIDIFQQILDAARNLKPKQM